MRPIVLVALMLATGCADNGTLYFLATTAGPTNGVAMRSSPGMERDAQIGMNNVTCLIGVGTGTINQEWDYPSTSEAVTDVHWQGQSEVVAVVAPDQVFLQTNLTRGEVTSAEYNVPRVEQVQLFDEGFVALSDSRGDCAVTFQGDAAITIPVDCAEGATLAASDDSDQAFIGSSAGLNIVTAQGWQFQVSDRPSSLLNWDPTADVLYTAEPGGTELLILEEDGSPRHSVDFGHSITAVDSFSQVGHAVVTLEEDGYGAVYTVDGETGEIVLSQVIPSPVTEVYGATDGSSMAMVTPEAVHFYAVGSAWDMGLAAWETYEQVRPRDPSD